MLQCLVIVLTCRVHVLESRELALLDPVNNTLHAVLGYGVGLNCGNAIAGSDVVKEPLGGGRITHDGQNISLGAQSGNDG